MPLDWTVLLRAFCDASDWLLDVAVHTARDFPDEVAAVERVRTFLRARGAGQEARVRGEDLLFTFALVLAAIERDLSPRPHRPPFFVNPAGRSESAPLHDGHAAAPPPPSELRAAA